KEDADRTSEAFAKATAALDMELIKYALSPDNVTLIATYTTPQHLSKQDRESLTPFLKDSSKVYTWERSHFK
ncbi:MAG: DUF3256 family protein, partial [Tannerellaceae bacterium]